MNEVEVCLFDDACLTSIKNLVDNTDREVNLVLCDFEARRITTFMRPILQIIWQLEQAVGFNEKIYSDLRTNVLYDSTLNTYCHS